MFAAPALKLDVCRSAAPRPRLDLRTGIVAAGQVEARNLGFEQWIEALAAARAVWNAADRAQPLSAPAPAFLFEPGAASRLDALLRGAGFGMRSVTIEFDETDLKIVGEAGFAAIERLRARGWGVALACGAACALPIGARLRGLLTEILVEAPETLRPVLALDTAPEPLLGRV
ncbi:MAG: hypothetical protein ABUS57_22410, partial [Pseudomonadota bacterium]